MISFGKIVLFIGCILSTSSSNILVNADVEPTVTNLALDKTAEQSTTWEDDVASKAVDGIKVGDAYQATQFGINGIDEWWKVYLGANKSFVISKIIIYNRETVIENCCAGRLNDAVVKILQDGTVKWTSTAIVAEDYNPLHLVIEFDNFGGLETINGNEVMVELGTNEILNMREVEVMGYEDTSWTGNAAGDPHFKTFQDIFFSYHAACDILLLTSVIHEVMVQIRTTRVDTHRQLSYSYISQAAVKIQDVILEVSADGTLLINGEDSSDFVPSSIAGGYAGLTKTIKGTKRNIISYKVDLGSGRSIDLRSNTKTGMMYIDVDGHFSDSKGLLGPSEGEDHGLYSRDGTIMDMAAGGAYNSYSESWQVLSDEPMLFQEARSPQHPAGCRYTAATNTNKEDEDGVSGVSPNLRRRLTDAVELSKDEAMKACADAVPGEKKDFCVMDVMLTGDLDAAEDEFYYLN
jgi:hypothetical protein